MSDEDHESAINRPSRRSVLLGGALGVGALTAGGASGIVGDALGETRTQSVPTAPVGEVGITTVTSEWSTVSFDREYDSPVVIARPLSYRGTDFNTFGDDAPAHTRVRNVSAQSAELRVEEWEYQDGTHGENEVSYLVIEQGRHELPDGTSIQVGTTVPDPASPFYKATHGTTVSFGSTFSERPVVLSGVQTANDETAVVTRQRNATASSVDLALQVERGVGGARPAGEHGQETIGWVAIASGSGTNGDAPYEVASVGGVSQQWSTVGFETTFDAPPAFIASMATTNGDQPANLRYADRTAESVRVFSHEEQSGGFAELIHAGERVDYLAMPQEASLIALNVFDVGEPTLRETTIDEGDEAVVTVDVTNNAESEETFVAVVRVEGANIDGTYETSTSVDIAGGVTQSVSLPVEFAVSGTFDVSLNDIPVGTLTVDEVTPDC
ncbi:hypothetical protein [Halomarina rubra]|uniref:Uncharacterized protein n=1 Tax=Halomarina rubra TaxID=2071873 RepID=A0ABD6AQE4_9EURY|nr:hypothetical protein [Halomarina rubra]